MVATRSWPGSPPSKRCCASATRTSSDMVFDYVAITAGGSRQTGRVEAQTRDEALGRIKEMGHHPVRVGAVENSEAPSQAPVARSGRITAGEIAQFMRQFADLIL